MRSPGQGAYVAGTDRRVIPRLPHQREQASHRAGVVEVGSSSGPTFAREAIGECPPNREASARLIMQGASFFRCSEFVLVITIAEDDPSRLHGVALRDLSGRLVDDSLSITAR